ncbi:MAG TPA: flagellar biosynthetic protein FliR [Phycisphaerae bacterium]
MNLTITQLPLLLPSFVLVLLRISGLMIAAPIFGSNAIPRRIKAALAMVVALAVFPLVTTQAALHLTLADAFVGAIGEVLIGLVIGLGMGILFLGAELAGALIGQQAGLALGQIFNPLLENDTTALGQLFFLVHLTIFLIVGGHRQLLRALLDTFKVIPVLSFRQDERVLMLATELLSSAFILALRLAGPVLIALTLTTLALGFVSRAMPQLNILSVGFSVQILAALLMAGLVLAMSGDLLASSITDGLQVIRSAFGLGELNA